MLKRCVLIAFAFLTGCSGVAGAGNHFLPAPLPLGQATAGIGRPPSAAAKHAVMPSATRRRGRIRVRLTLTVPRRRRDQPVHGKHPATISPATQSVGIAVNRGTATVFDATPASPQCSAGPKGTTCTFDVGAPPGTDTFVVTTYDGTHAAGSILDRGTATVKIEAGAANLAAITLGPVVSNDNDSGTGSLRYAVGSANPGDTILFLIPTTSTITIVNGPITLDGRVSIAGPGVTTSGGAYHGVSISGNQTAQLFLVKTGATAAISGLILELGAASTVHSPGGAVGNAGNLTLTNDVFLGNASTVQSPLLARAPHTVRKQSVHPHCATTYFEGGAVYNNGTLAVSDSTFDSNLVANNSGNCVEGHGGAIYNDEFGILNVDHSVLTDNAAFDGGAVYNDSEFGQATFSNDTFTNNAGCNVVTGCSSNDGNGAGIYDEGGPGVIITGSTFENNVDGGEAPGSQGDGGALYLATGSPSITGSTFTANLAGGGTNCSRGDGGAIYFADASGVIALEIDGDTFTGNQAGGDANGSGGAIAAFLPVQGSNDAFSSNTAISSGDSCTNSGQAQGGAVDAEGGATFTGSTFKNNTATGATEAAAGAIWIQTTMRLTGDTFTSNTAVASSASVMNTEAFGGAVYSTAAGTISGSTFTTNKATTQGPAGDVGGGALYAEGAIVSEGNSFTSNAVTGSGALSNVDGGAIFAQETFTSNEDTFTSNTGGGPSRTSGGALYNGSTLTLSAGTFDSNTVTGAFGYGGGIFNEGSTVTISNTTFTSNAAQGVAGSGGAIYDNGGLTLDGSTLSNNKAVLAGGGIYGNGQESIAGTTISGNAVSAASQGQGGGGIYVQESGIAITSSTISGNKTTLAGTQAGGGGIFANASFTLNGSTVSGNSVSGDFSTSGGGGIYAVAQATINNTTITGNASSVDGGGIESAGGSGTLTNATIYQNHASGAGGNINNVSGSIGLTNSIVAGGAAASGPDVENGGSIQSGDYNIVQTPVSGTQLTGTTTHDIMKDPLLLALANNGGTTFTDADQPHSPGTGAIPFATNQCNGAGTFTNVDQRGYARGSQNVCDIGAYEYAGLASALRHHASPRTSTTRRSGNALR
jgi:fibronectin-binding autotransporter adhesin